MALPNASNGDYLPIVKYDAKSGKFRRRDRVERNGTWETIEADIPLPFAFVADFQSLEIGWTDLHRKPPSFRLMPYPLENQLQGIAPNIGPRPDDAHKASFRLLVMVKFGAEPELRHFGQSSQVVYRAFSALHDQFLAEVTNHPVTECPVVQVKAVAEVRGQHGTNYEPQFSIAKWVQRPEAFNDHQPTNERGDAWVDEGAQDQGPDPNADLPFN